MKSSKRNIIKNTFCVLAILFLALGFFVVMLIGMIALNKGYNVYAESDYQNEATKALYAKAKENCFLFKTSDTSSSHYSNVFFIVPKTYFVKILTELSGAVYKVEYAGKIGYVSSDSVIKASFTPINTTLKNVTFSTLKNVATQLRSTPTAENTSNVKVVMDEGASNIRYIASTIGIKPNGGESDIWYYCEYQPTNDPTSVYVGYVYSEKTEALSEITENIETNPVVEPPEKPSTDDRVKMSSTVKIVLISLISAPIVLVFVLLVVNFKRNAKPKKVKEKKTIDTETHEAVPPKRKVQSLAGKKLTKKKEDSYKFVSRGDALTGLNPSFPTYEVDDDDDLL